MLIRFIVSNFLSFKEETEFNMLASADQKHHKEHIYKRNSLDLLKTAALYGANGAGKSNLIKAISLLESIVRAGGKESLFEIKKYKLELEYRLLPTSFEIEFISNDVVFLYGLIVQNNEILEEWLYKSGLDKKKDEVLFHRIMKNGSTKIEFSENYSRTSQDQFNLEFVRKNLVDSDSLLFNVLANLKEGFQDIKIAFEWFKVNLLIYYPNTKPVSALIELLLKFNSFRDFSNSFLCSFHTGISKIDVKSFPFEDFIGKIDESLEKTRKQLEKQSIIHLNSNGTSEGIVAVMEDEEVVIKRFVSEHKNRNNESIEFFLDEESDGTNRLIDLVPAFFFLLSTDAVILIDEIDQSIHPILLKELIKKFVTDEETKGQFIFTTHEANLLDQSIFRRDEIWFVEKDQGETKLYPLSDFDIRYDLDIRKGYLNGRFGAIPFMGNLQNLNWDQYAEAE